MFSWKLLALGLCAQVLPVAALELIDLTATNVDQVIDGSTNVLVYFYLNVCANCKAMQPEVQALADVLVSTDNLRVAQLNGDDEPGLAERFGVDGGPIFKWFSKGLGSITNPEPFYVVHFHGRLSNTLIKKASSWLPQLAAIEVLPESKPMIKLRAGAAFDAAVEGPLGSWLLVHFHTPWSESDDAKRGLTSVGHAFEAHGDLLRIAKLEVDTKVERDLAYAHGVSDFPALLLFKAGPSATGAVLGATAEQPADAVAELAARTGLAPTLGRKRARAKRATPPNACLDALGPLLAQWAATTLEGIPDDQGQRAAAALLPDARTAAAHAAATAATAATAAPAAGDDDAGMGPLGVAARAALYVKTVEKVAEKGVSYLAEERARVDALLARGVADTKRPLFYARRDILDAFITALDAAKGHAATGNGNDAHADL